MNFREASNSHGVAASVFLYSRGVPELVMTTLYGFHYLMVVKAHSTWGMRLTETELP